MKKFFALLLALVMVLSLVACGDKKTDDNQDANNTDDQQGGTTTYTNPDDIDDNMTSEDGKYEVAFVTDVGQLKDKSFNQGTFDGCRGRRRQGRCLRRLHAGCCPRQSCG